jgi:transmembrane sensor
MFLLFEASKMGVLSYNFKKMTTENFTHILAENKFKEWVLNPTNVELSKFWENWMDENPDSKEDIENFKKIILKMDDDKSSFNTQVEEKLWLDIKNTIAQSEQEEATPIVPSTRIYMYKKWMGIAAGLALMIAATFFFFRTNEPNDLTAKTTFGETRTLSLPDGSQVVLNANSSLTWKDAWTNGKDREVSLKGEAYFIVNEQGKAEHRDRFIVHTSDLDVEVLGTRFNVNTYRPQTQVILQKGSVEIKTSVNDKEKKYNLVPGQKAVFDRNNDNVQISQVNSNVYVGWKDNRFVFDQTPLSEVAIMLENTYGIKVIIEDKELRTKQISGEIPTSERKSFLLALSSLYGLKINEQSKDTLYITQ